MAITQSYLYEMSQCTVWYDYYISGIRKTEEDNTYRNYYSFEIENGN
jgi:hypothetical protein